MSDKHRLLPSWMTQKEKMKVKKKVNKEPLKKKEKRKTSRSVFYCMNEKELVEAALLFISESEDVMAVNPHKEEETSTSHVLTKPAMKTFIDSSSSETDLDISEVQTLPVHAGVPVNDGVPVHAGVEAQRREPDQHHSGFMDHEEEEEDDLQLVRDIFFS
ncbi:cell cycle regulator of non-homologous end joining isoform X1 [Gouania willdenowi]|uniref:cell cycle regulator of non-homologous end joining isoform X1 n=1 Tax=Gouania willdenowi TaxID=441366 RepID=UPI00105454CB|nr:cell cycle regulator of non-homologous end joining-like isoform X1 [Gouania willdenowi]